MSSIAIDPGLALPVLPDKHHCHALLRARLPQPGKPELIGGDRPPHAYWPATMFGLERVSIYADAAPKRRAAILERCGRALLEEAYFIEKAGITFAATMVLLGQTVEERMLYATFAGEEARHFHGVRSFMHGTLPQQPEGDFLQLLSEVISSGDRTTLQFTIQIVLEGFGLTHYRALRDGCLDRPLRQLLTSILHDEAGHHGSGRVLFDHLSLEQSDLTRIEEVIAPMLGMMQVGPQAVLRALDVELDGLTRSQRVTVVDELDGPLHAQAKLGILRQLMRFDGLEPLVARLASRGLFTSLRSKDCV